jgi:hypothetical protein
MVIKSRTSLSLSSKGQMGVEAYFHQDSNPLKEDICCAILTEGVRRNPSGLSWISIVIPEGKPSQAPHG